MTTLEQKVAISREKFHTKLPQIHLAICRVEKSSELSVRRLIVEGSPVLLGAVLPSADIGGLTPLKLVASANGKTAVGLLKGSLKSRVAIIDYGFTRGECQVEEVVFTSKDTEIFDQISRLPNPRARGSRFLRKLTNWLAWALWKTGIGGIGRAYL